MPSGEGQDMIRCLIGNCKTQPTNCRRRCGVVQEIFGQNYDPNHTVVGTAGRTFSVSSLDARPFEAYRRPGEFSAEPDIPPQLGVPATIAQLTQPCIS